MICSVELEVYFLLSASSLYQQVAAVPPSSHWHPTGHKPRHLVSQLWHGYHFPWSSQCNAATAPIIRYQQGGNHTPTFYSYSLDFVDNKIRNIHHCCCKGAILYFLLFRNVLHESLFHHDSILALNEEMSLISTDLLEMLH